MAAAPNCGSSVCNRLPGFSVMMKHLAQRGGYGPRFTVAYSAAIDADDRQHDLTRRCDEGLTRFVGLVQRESALLDGNVLLLDRIEHDATGDAVQDRMIGVPGDELASVGDDPGVGRGRLGDETGFVNKTGVASALVNGRLPRQHVRHQSDGLDVDAAPAVFRDADNRDALGRECLVARLVEPTCGHDETWRDGASGECVVALGDATGDLQIVYSVADAVSRQHLAQDHAKRGAREWHANAQLAERTFEAIEVAP